MMCDLLLLIYIFILYWKKRTTDEKLEQIVFKRILWEYNFAIFTHRTLIHSHTGALLYSQTSRKIHSPIHNGEIRRLMK